MYLGVCPTGEKAYVEALTMSPRECQPSVVSGCPNNFLCRPNSSRNRYYCCGSAAAGKLFLSLLKVLIFGSNKKLKK